MKKIIMSFLIAFTLCSGFPFAYFGGCAFAPDNGDTGGSHSEIADPGSLELTSLRIADNLSGKQSERVFRAEGRTFIRYGGLACDFSCTGIRFNSVCKGEISVKFRVSAECYFTVYINGERSPERICVREADNNSFVTVAYVETYGVYEVSVVKQSQYPMAYCELLEVRVLGSFGKRPEQRERFIEFYGDSTLNGSNIYTGGTSAATSDATLAFAYLAARELNVDCNVIGRGGMGLYRKDGKTEGMNEIWDLCGGGASPEVAYYDFGRVPDCVVVKLGTNDVISDYYTDKRYKDSIEEMVFNLRSVYGDEIKIIWCYGFHERFDEKWDVAKQTLDGLNANGSILFCKLPPCALPKEMGGDGWHPNVEMSENLASVLTEFIRENVY